MTIKRVLLLFLCTSFCLAAIAAFAQEQAQRPRLTGYFTIRRPAQSVDLEAIKSAAASGTTLPVWTFDQHSDRDGNSYIGAMVGRDPFNNPGSVSVPVNVVPLILNLNNS